MERKPLFGGPQRYAAGAFRAFRTVSEGKFCEVQSSQLRKWNTPGGGQPEGSVGAVEPHALHHHLVDKRVLVDAVQPFCSGAHRCERHVYRGVL